MIIQNGAGITSLLNGETVKTALNPANETVGRGIYDPTTLSAVDADLQAGNIKLAENIFGFVGTLIEGAVDTVTKYADATLGTGVTYTPADPGIFAIGDYWYVTQYFSTVNTAWYSYRNRSYWTYFSAIGDGTNFRIKNLNVGNYEYTIFRHYMATGTYERAMDEDLAGGASYTPAASGFFDVGSEAQDPDIEINKTTAGWTGWDSNNVAMPHTVTIGDGANWRVKNNTGGLLVHVTMRALMSS